MVLDGIALIQEGALSSCDAQFTLVEIHTEFVCIYCRNQDAYCVTALGSMGLATQSYVGAKASKLCTLTKVQDSLRR